MPRLAVFPKGFLHDIMAGKLPLLTWIEMAATLGVDGIEMYSRFFPDFDPALTRQVKAALAAANLPMPMMCNSPDFTQPDAAARRREVEHHKRVIDLTAQLGGRWCRVLSGQKRPGLDERAALAWVVEGIGALVPHAEAAGIVLVIENHYKDPLWEFPEWAQSGERFRAVLDGVPELMVQYDPSNAVVAGEDPYALLESVLPRVATMQASDRFLEGGTLADLARLDADPTHGYATILKHGVIGRGLNDYDRIFGTLARAGYAGWVSIEDGEAPSREEGMANLRDSAAFLRGKFARHFPS